MINELLYGALAAPLTTYSVLKIIGSDSAEYLQRQFTNDLSKISNREAQLSCRLDRSGRIYSFFYVGKYNDDFYIIIENALCENTINELNKFIIMEDVEVLVTESNATVVVGPSVENNISEVHFKTKWADQDAFIIIDPKEVQYPEIDKETYRFAILSTAWPELGLTLNGDELVNETSLNKLAVDYKKGCFLGQETASKIESRRGAAKYPVLLESVKESKFIDNSIKKVWGSFSYENKYYTLASVSRDLQVEGKKLKSDDIELTVRNIPLVSSDKTQKAEDLFHKAIEEFHKKEEETALKLLDLAIQLDPGYADAYESKGAILGQLDRFKDAIEAMDELLKVDKNSVMAHTNKSLFYMKIGEIEKAEDEKSLATVASFQKLGEEAQVKKKIAEEEEKKVAELARRESMFKQVIEMDDRDAIANYGMADILFHRHEYDEAYKHLKIVLEENKKYSTAYALLGKSCEKIGKIDEALDVYKKGIEVASAQGDMMPANEMQSRLNQLSV